MQSYCISLKKSLIRARGLVPLILLTSVSLWGDPPPQPGVFYVSSYAASGSHTDYDIARQAADAFATANPWSGSVLILKSSINQTCDAAPLPSLGLSGTTSIIGYGSGQSRLIKAEGCSASSATLSHPDSPNGSLSRGWFQGFSVDANHIDYAACEFYGMSLTTFLDLRCGDAAESADHEAEFGNHDAGNLGWMDSIYIYGLSTFDSAPVGQGAILTPVWAGGVLSSVRVVNSGTSGYSKAARAQLVGPDTASCSSIPTLELSLSPTARVSGATITNAGNCQSTNNIYLLIQDGTPVTYGMKFTNMADSHVFGLQPNGETTYGEAWLDGSANNSIYNERVGTNQLVELSDNGNGNRHINPQFVNPGEYAAAVYSQNGTIAGATLSWSDSSYVAAAGYFAGNDPSVYQDWALQNSSCANSSGSHFAPVTTRAGLVSSTNPIPLGLKPQNIGNCDGTMSVDWPIQP